MDDRIDPPLVGDERPSLEGWLDYHRATLAAKCAGLDGEQLCRRSVPPSSLSLIGLVRHMAEVERGWFQRCLAGEDIGPIYYDDANRDGDFDDVDPATVDADLQVWRDECDCSRQILSGVATLDEVAARERWDSKISVRWIVVHMIEEYARHNGHADLLRQCIDGTIGE